MDVLDGGRDAYANNRLVYLNTNHGRQKLHHFPRIRGNDNARVETLNTTLQLRTRTPLLKPNSPILNPLPQPHNTLHSNILE